jgi:hypothetical protein
MGLATVPGLENCGKCLKDERDGPISHIIADSLHGRFTDDSEVVSTVDLHAVLQ